jgi:hypothetical protein
MAREKTKRSLKPFLLRVRPVLRFFKGFRGSPDAIAGGFSLGLFIALTPTIGLQLVIAVFLATLFKVSRPAALLSVMVTNPLTIPPIFTFNYWVGSIFFEGPSIREVYRHLIHIAAEMAKLNMWEVGAQIKSFAEASHDMLIPLIAGSMLMAIVAGVFSYVVLVRFLWFFLLRGDRKKLLRDQRNRDKSVEKKHQEDSHQE